MPSIFDIKFYFEPEEGEYLIFQCPAFLLNMKDLAEELGKTYYSRIRVERTGPPGDKGIAKIYATDVF